MAEGETESSRYRKIDSDSEGRVRINEFLHATTRHRSHFVWMVRRMTGCSDEAEDIVHMALMKGYANLHRVWGGALLSTWLRTIVVNTAGDHLASIKSRISRSKRDLQEAM